MTTQQLVPSICRNCGFVGTEADPVTMITAYVGGKGYIPTGPFCVDLVACWYRWDDGARGTAWAKKEGAK